MASAPKRAAEIQTRQEIRAHAVAMAACHDLNEELTIILSGANELLLILNPWHPATTLLVDMRLAAARAAFEVKGLMDYTRKKGALPAAVRLENLIERVSP